jgi:RNA-directed DNA polymerase
MLSELIAEESGLERSFIEKLARSASHRYKAYVIPKRTGGERIIQHPSRQLKFLQRWLVERVFRAFLIHPAATAYKSGASVRNNAMFHASSNYLLRLDFENFFPSIKQRDVERFIRVNKNQLPFELSPRDVLLISQLVTRNGSIAIGAPSSPIISNQIMYAFDVSVYRHCVESNISYSRYADDLYFSTNRPNVLFEVHEKVKRIISDLAYPRLTLNHDKTSHSSRKRKRLVTGLSLTSDRKISLGRHKKRMVKSLIHRFANGEIEPKERNYLAGYLSYAKSVEPTFLDRLATKYGQYVVAAAMKLGS